MAVKMLSEVSNPPLPVAALLLVRTVHPHCSYPVPEEGIRFGLHVGLQADGARLALLPALLCGCLGDVLAAALQLVGVQHDVFGDWAEEERRGCGQELVVLQGGERKGCELLNFKSLSLTFAILLIWALFFEREKNKITQAFETGFY